MLPIFLNFENRLCVVVGGGVVGRRKALALLDAGASVRLVCLEPQPPDMRHDRLIWLHEPFTRAHLQGASLAFAAATPAVNAQVSDDCRRLGIWLNRADDPAQCDFHMPAVLRRGDLTLAVGTGGAAPLLARRICDWLAIIVDDAFGKWAALVGEMRQRMQASIADSGRRRQVQKQLCDWKWLERLRSEDPAAIRQAMCELVGSTGDANSDP